MHAARELNCPRCGVVPPAGGVDCPSCHWLLSTPYPTPKATGRVVRFPEQPAQPEEELESPPPAPPRKGGWGKLLWLAAGYVGMGYALHALHWLGWLH